MCSIAKRGAAALVAASLLAGCADTAEVRDSPRDMTQTGEQSIERGADEADEQPDPVPPPPRCDGATQWRYDPLGTDGVMALPDDVHTVTDDMSGTGRRVILDPVHDTWLSEQEDAVAAIYESL